jgi:DNA-binding transcriptional ArsR family regulator
VEVTREPDAAAGVDGAERITVSFAGMGQRPNRGLLDPGTGVAGVGGGVGGGVGLGLGGDDVAAVVAGEIRADVLMRKTLAPLRVVVPDLIPEGTTVLAAPPKVGKSWLMYQLAVEVAYGGELLGRPVNGGLPGDVLYLALEDSERRAQERLRVALRGRGERGGRNGAGGLHRLTLRWDAPSLGDGLEDLLDEWLASHAEGVLVIVDTLGRVRGGRAGDERRNAYQVDVRDLGAVQRLMLGRGAALVIVHHTNKAGGDDFVQRVSGTHGIVGSADTILSLARKRNDPVGAIEVTSRELVEQEVPVMLDVAGGGGWVVVGEAALARTRMSPERRNVLDLLLEAARAGEGPMTPSELADRLGIKRITGQYHLKELAEGGLALRVVGGYVVSPGRYQAGGVGGAGAGGTGGRSGNGEVH